MLMKLKKTHPSFLIGLKIIIISLAVIGLVWGYNFLNAGETEQRVGYLRDVYREDGRWVAVFDNAQILFSDNRDNPNPLEGLETLPLSVRTLVKIYSLSDDSKEIDRYFSPSALRNLNLELGTDFQDIPFTATLKQTKLVELEEIL